MTTPPPVGPMPAADTLALEQRLIAEAAIADVVSETTAWLASGGLRDDRVSDDQWQVNRLAELSALRDRLAKTARKAQAQQLEIPGVVRQAAQRASGLGRVPAGTQQVVDDLTAALGRMWAQVPGLLTRAGQNIVTEATAQVRAGNQTRVQATTRALDRLLSAGISPARDAAGRRWTAPAYTEMRMRTGVLDAGRLGREDAAREYGTPYVQVSDALRECPMCRPWEGKVLSLDGDDPDGIAAGTLAEARAAGLAHPNCRHSWAAYFPGLSQRAKPSADPKGFDWSQQQRALERQVREAKLRLLAAQQLEPDGDVARRAQVRVKALQGRLRELTAESGQRRKYEREQVPVG